MITDRMHAVVATELTRDEVLRYSRHLLLPEVGVEGQQRLKAARVLCVGAGGLGSPAAMYLAAAGVGTLGLVDADEVDVSNLQRQIIHGTSDVGRSKIASASDRLREINPHVAIEAHETRLDERNALALVSNYDVVVDGSDNFPTRYLVNDACVIARRPNAYGSISRFEGQASIFASADGPCYRCLHPEPPPVGLDPELRRRWRAWSIARNHRDDSGHRDREADSGDRRAAHRPVPHLRRAADAISRDRAAPRS